MASRVEARVLISMLLDLYSHGLATTRGMFHDRCLGGALGIVGGGRGYDCPACLFPARELMGCRHLER